MVIEKWEHCPDCGESGKQWAYDVQKCAACGYGEFRPIMSTEDTLKALREHPDAGPVFHIKRDATKCNDGGKHDFTGWRDFPDGNGGEQVCSKCGVGAMAYTIAVSW